MEWLSDHANDDSGSSRIVGLSSGVALVLIGLRQRSLAGAIISALGGRLAYQSFKKGPRYDREEFSSVGETQTGAGVYGGNGAGHLDVDSSTAAEISTGAVQTRERHDHPNEPHQSVHRQVLQQPLLVPLACKYIPGLLSWFRYSSEHLQTCKPAHAILYTSVSVLFQKDHSVPR